MIAIANPWRWAGFIVSVIAILALDLFVLGGCEAHRMSFREAAGWSPLGIMPALLWWYLDQRFGAEIATDKALEFFTSYLIGFGERAEEEERGSPDCQVRQGRESAPDLWLS